LARSHYFDIRKESSNPRNIEKSKIDIVWFRNALDMKLSSRIWQLKILLTRVPIITYILRKLTDINNENIYNFILNQLKENRYIKKELDTIVENRANLISAFDSFFYYQINKTMMLHDDKFVLHIDKIRQSANTLLNYQTTSDDELNYGIDVFLKATLFVISCFADAYLLARIFKDFNMDKIDEKAYKGATNQPKRAHNIIIYAGDAHSHNYREFLSYIGFTEIDSTGINLDNPDPYLPSIPNKPKNCLDMRNIQQPFFSYKRYDESTFNVIKQSNRILKAIIKYD